MPNKIRFLPVPPNEEESPSWVAIIITLVLQLYPITAILAFIRIHRMWKNHKLDRYRKYQRAVGDEDSITIRNLSKKLGVSKSDARSVVSDMISRGYLGQEAYIDYSDDTLYITKAAAREAANTENKNQFTIDLSDVSASLNDIVTGISGIAGEVASTMKNEFKAKSSGKYRNASSYGAAESEMHTESAARPEPAKAEPAPRPEPKPAPKEEPKAEAVVTDMTESEATLARLKQLNDDILDEEVSRKIDRIALLTGDIYAFVSLNPERAGEVRKFMNYYLPTTMKLLTSYSLLERQSYQGDNIVNARHDIEKILDTLVHAFEKQLDQLFATDAVDISSDIQVLETMIAKDGLSNDSKGIKLQI